jgi:hypothetical protein
MTLPDPLPDGTPLADLRDAMEAAWIAGDRQLAYDLAKYYALHNRMCLRCGRAARYAFMNSTDCTPDSILARLCMPCLHEETPPMGPTTIIDSVAWTRETRVEPAIDLKPLLDAFKKQVSAEGVEIKFRTLKAT